MCEKYVIGYWISEKKRQKFNWEDFSTVCESEGFQLKMIDVNLNLESQGPFHVLLHKLTDTLAHADNGDKNAKAIIARIEEYICQHPEAIVIDPFENIRMLSNRYKSYEIIQEGMRLNDVFTPKFTEIKSQNIMENLSTLKLSGIKFPFVCKPLFAHGSSNAHKLMIVFNEEGLKDCQSCYVAQNFINHNAILYKIYIVGKYFHVVERPSLKNFYEEDCTALNTLYFNSHDICKSASKSKWSILSEVDVPSTIKPKWVHFENLKLNSVSFFQMIYMFLITKYRIL
ncbi:hypothetical protein KM043_014007 [Ampulex compressa]|nr:hypothetical protein KM043_014007 [Ampulex compressa]